MATEVKKQKGGQSKQSRKGAYGPFTYIMVATILTLPVLFIIDSYCKNSSSIPCFYYEKSTKVFNWEEWKSNLYDVLGKGPTVEVSSSKSTHSKSKGHSKYSSVPNVKDFTKLSETPWMNDPIPGTKVLNTEDIKFSEGGPYYLVIVGHVFDVSSGGEMYAPGSGYHGFIGFIDKNGKFTPYFKQFHQWVKAAEEGESKEQELKKMFPPCNVQWNAQEGSKLCGGIQRDWKGFPRRFFEPNQEPRCVCVHPNMLNDPRIKSYEGCDLQSHECKPKE